MDWENVLVLNCCVTSYPLDFADSSNNIYYLMLFLRTRNQEWLSWLILLRASHEVIVVLSVGAGGPSHVLTLVVVGRL